MIKKNNSWIKNKRIEHGRVFHPLVYKEKSTDLIVIDNFNTDTRSLYSINLTTGKRVLLFSDPNNDINWVHLSEDERHVYGLTTQPAYLEYHFPNIDSEEAVLKNLIAKFKGYRVNITSNTKNLNQYVFSVTSDVEPGAWFLFNREKNSIDFLLKRNDRIESDKMRSMYAFNFSARDGVKLSGYLTLPSGEKKNNLPAVMLVHSGPFGVRDNWGYNHEVQLLSAKGYAVIQVNYRGSTGYGYQFESAGYTHWGDKIQFDILDSVKYLSEQSIIDPKRICIMGTYFGGYSAVQASILAPRQFVCAIATSGVYDLKEMYDEDSINDYIWGKTFLKKTLGHIPSMLKNFSPINHVEQLETPLLLVHGEKDMKNPLSQAKALKKKLEQFKKSYQWLELNGDGHGFYNEKNRLNYYQQVLKFLDQHNPVAN